jgi:hypothetical protein
MSQPAKLLGFQRAFCLQSARWEGGVATLAPDNKEETKEASVTYGSVVELSPAELARLDSFESGYRKERVTVIVGGAQKGGASQEVRAIAYIAGVRPATAKNGFLYTKAMTVEPSEQYLCAIHGMLREHWDMQGVCISINKYKHTPTAGGSIATVREWHHPRTAPQSLASLCVEISLLRSSPYVMPAAIATFVGKLHAVGVGSCADLAAALPSADETTGINSKLRGGGHTLFSHEELSLMQRLLKSLL